MPKNDEGLKAALERNIERCPANPVTKVSALSHKQCL